jgi:integrase
MAKCEPLEVAAERYFTLRRKLGYQLRTERDEVLLFAREMDALHRRKITLPLVVGWARSSRNGSPKYAAWRYEAVRRFLTVAACTRRGTVVPPPGYLGRPFGRRSPHVYSDDEVKALLAATRELTPTTGLRPWTYRTLFGLLASTGLRVGEALALDRADIDCTRGTLLVRRDKSRASREIPLHASVVRALAAYGARRDARHPAPRAPAFFLTETRGTRLQYQYVNCAFRKLRRTLRWSQPPLPTVHDLRHSYAVRKFLEWFRAGKDVDAEIPALSAYMGHKKPASTYWYLSAVPELLYLITGYTERFSSVRPPKADA